MSPLTRVYLWILFSSAVGAIALTVFASLGPPTFAMFFYAQLSSTLWLIAGFSLVSVGCSMSRDRGKLRRVMIVGLIAGPLGAIGWLAMIWSMLDVNDVLGLYWFSTTMTVGAVYVMLVGILLQFRGNNSWLKFVRMATITTAGLLAVDGIICLCLFPVVDESWTYHDRNLFEEIGGRTCGVLGILAGVGALTTMVAATIPRLGNPDVPDSQRLSFVIACPRCQSRQQLKTEGDECDNCGLKIKVTAT